MSQSRRSFLAMVGALAAGANCGVRAQTVAAPYSDKDVTDDWIRRWMEAPGAAAGTLRLGRFADRMYFLTKEIGWTPNPGQEGRKVEVPAGFVTDFASIPRIFWTVLPPDGLYTYPAILHDYLYWDQSVSRDKADLVLRYAMEDFNVDAVIVNAIYAGVRAGGSSAWSGNASLKASGERRIMREFPTDPTERWGEWKRRPGVMV